MRTMTMHRQPSDPSAIAPNRAGWTALTAVVPMVWGTTYIVTTHLLPDGHPLFAALMRSLPAGLIALSIGRRLPRGSWWWKSLVLGTLNMGAFFPLLFVAAQELPGGVAATLGAVQPIVVAFLAVAILRERLSFWRVWWGIVGMTGIALVVLGPAAAMSPLGVAAGLAGAASMGTGVVLTKKWGRPEGVSAISVAGWQLTAGGLVLLLPALLIDGVPADIDGTAVLGYVWLGLIGGLVAYTIWFSGIRHLPVTATALLGLLSPLVAAVLGAVIAGEALSVVQIIGFAIALTAMVAGQLPSPTPRRPRKPVRPRRFSTMERDDPAVGEALDAVAEARSANVERLRRPKRHWVMLGLLLSIFALLPYLSGLPALVQYVAPVVAAVGIALVAARKQPTAVRKIRLLGRMVLQLAGFALLGGVVVGVSQEIYADVGWWWVPLGAALLLFGAVATLGPLMDRSWARHVSNPQR